MVFLYPFFAQGRCANVFAQRPMMRIILLPIVVIGSHT